MKKFTIITKDGSKWLRPVNPHRKHLVDEFGLFRNPDHVTFGLNSPDLPYIGNRPEGTTLDESEVTAITQARHKESSSLTWFNVYDNGNWDYYETRTAYTDAESHDRHISDEVHPILAWLRTNGEISEDGKHVTYSCEEIEAFFNKPNWMRFKED